MTVASGNQPWPWLNSYEAVPELSGYRPVIGDRGMISSPHYLASAIGGDILKAGGNAVDAAISASAALMVLCPMQCGPGGDALWMISDSTNHIIVLDAAGPAPSAASASTLHDEGFREIPKRGARAVTVPGAVAGWFEAHGQFASLPMEDLLFPAAALSESGFIATRHTHASFLACESELLAKGAFQIFHALERAPNLYERVEQPALATLLRQLGRSSPRWFYEGEPARAMAAACQRWGGWLTEQDMASYTAKWIAPVSKKFRHLEVFTTPPPSQGFCLLAALQAFASVSPGPLAPFDPATTHLQIESIDAALQLRDRLNCDGGLPIVSDALDEMKGFARNFDPLQRQSRERVAGLGRKGDTAHIAVIDKDGLAVSLIQSLYYDFGTCIPVLPGGFTLQNRGAAFSLEQAHPALLNPGKRPPHTLMPTMVRNGSELRYILGCMGGDGQMQTQLQLLVGMNEGGLDPQQAVSRARWYLDRGDNQIMAEAGALDVPQLKTRGHKVVELNRFEDVVGHAQVIEIIARRVLVGAADPRCDGQVAVA
jgi:gamma-glutamyltranspeptidase/glutathione hydrolase